GINRHVRHELRESVSAYRQPCQVRHEELESARSFCLQELGLLPPLPVFQLYFPLQAVYGEFQSPAASQPRQQVREIPLYRYVDLECTLLRGKLTDDQDQALFPLFRITPYG